MGRGRPVTKGREPLQREWVRTPAPIGLRSFLRYRDLILAALDHVFHSRLIVVTDLIGCALAAVDYVQTAVCG